MNTMQKFSTKHQQIKAKASSKRLYATIKWDSPYLNKGWPDICISKTAITSTESKIDANRKHLIKFNILLRLKNLEQLGMVVHASKTVFGRMQEYCYKFEARLGYVVSSRPT